MARIAYFYREMSEYIEIDLRMLRERHSVTVTGSPSRWPRPLDTWRKIAQADLVMSWFASWHALLPGLFASLQRKPFVLVVGGYDTACLPGIDYGHQRGGFKTWIARRVIALATWVVAISPFTVRELKAMGVDMARVAFVPLGLDSDRYASDAPRDATLIVTTGGVSVSNLTRKGLECFVRAAALMPETRFVLIGAWLDDAIGHLAEIATSNVTFTNRVSHESTVDWLWRAAVVVQASQHEAFGLSLAEGMMCGAVPVVTDVGSLSWVADGTGVVIVSQEPEVLAQGIRDALALPASANAAARSGVLRRFSVDARSMAMQRVLDGVPGPDELPTAA